jgi:26S proteasome regulatory subunit N3
MLLLQDVAEKLALPSAVDAEYICAKAIRDGGIDAVLDHAGGFLATRELTDLYSTNEPQVLLQCAEMCCSAPA